MKKKISALALISLMVAANASASGFRIPEQSVDSTAKAGANIASSTRADATYFNPANMSWLEDGTMIQGNLTYIHLTKNEYHGADGYSSNAEDENFVMPTGFIVSPYFGDFRFGISNTSPYGLAKRWKNNAGTGSAREFSMETFELNPTLSYRINDKVSLAGGVRMMYANATIKNVLYDMEGDTIEWGYNLALSVRPVESWNISATYRSKIDLNFSESDVRFNPTASGLLPPSAIISASTSVPAPAVLALSTSFQPLENLTVELTVDRTFWSAYDQLNIVTNPAGYSKSFLKDWDDGNAYRLGLSYDLNDALTLMAGFAYDECPSPNSTVGFELPDAPAWLYSVGFQYAMTENLDVGMAVLYDYKEERDVNHPGIGAVGEFTNGGAFLVSTGLNYRF
ncbi:OmpP1/FadL family transporter [Desulfotalea psychrophila]|uniref:Related to long-chain fatty acid transport protein (FadL) n=1 Tax=Desulfotalea psychrophila (strain LSv54 / DSM 12343) TaxID=177439 RepID=Q6AS80_DESPS|nr:OmpP1/FadL family transporter [Desulfotalea psychrophila]CAG34795.1 related to long-chain fatty acid transport protein (FadL precursor) [Desulfotalea psychrophila LSv54]